MTPHRRLRCVVLSGLVAAVVPAPGQDLQVNTFTTGDQEGSLAVTDPRGAFRLAWTSLGSLGGDADEESVQQRALPQFGAAQPAETQVNTTTTDDQRLNALSMGSDASFVVVWSGFQYGGDPEGISARRYNNLGVATGLDFAVNTLTSGAQRLADVAKLPDGGFVVVWESEGSFGSDNSGASVQMRRYDVAGVPVGPETQVNAHTTSLQGAPDVVALRDGWVVAWHSYGGPPPADPDAFNILARRVSAGGTLLGTDSVVSGGETIATCGIDQARLADDSYVVVWSNCGDVYARRFDAAGGPTTAPYLVNLLTPGSQFLPTVAADPLGGYFAAWQSTVQVDDPDVAIRMRRFDRADVGEIETLVNSHTTGEQRSPHLAADGDGDFMVTWTSAGSAGSDSSGDSVQARSFLGLLQAAHWRLDEGSGASVFDSAAAVADDGIAIGPTRIPHRGGGALSFDGVDDFVGLLTSADLEALGNFGTAVSLSAWVRLDLLPSQLASSFAGIFDATADNYVLFLDKVNAELRFRATDQNGLVTTVGIPESELGVGRWHHVVGVYDGSEPEVRIYLDGTLVDSVPLAATVPIRTSPAQVPAIGRNGQNNEHYFPGDIDDVIVWRRALDAEDILIHDMALFGNGFESGNTFAWSQVVP